MITRITIDWGNHPERLFDTLEEWLKRTRKGGVIPPMEVLSDKRPYAIGSVVSYDQAKRRQQSLDWKE